MTEEWKTLKQLWIENGEKPFDAVQWQGHRFHCEALSPKGDALGWDIEDRNAIYDGKEISWKFHKPKKKIMVYPALFKEMGNYFISGKHFVDRCSAEEFFGQRFIRLLLDQGVEVEVDE